MENLEGVVKFKRRIKDNSVLHPEVLEEINFWRNIFHIKGLIGKNPNKYRGFAYGNMSQRLNSRPLPRNKRKFVITGSQTGNLPFLTPKNYAVVYEYYPEENLIIEGGLARASSESLTHGAIYNLDNSIGAVVHCHSPDIWEHCNRLGIPATSESVEAGTPEMAKEVYRLWRETNLKRLRIFYTLGHIDGVFAFGKNLEEATMSILEYVYKTEKYLSQ